MSAPAEHQPTETSKKPLLKKWWLWAIVAVVVIGAASAIAGGGKQTAADPAASTKSATESPAATTEVPAVAGKPGKDASKLLEDAGFRVERDGGKETVIALGNWDATGTTPAAGEKAEPGSTVKLHLTRATERLAAEQAALEAANKKAAADAAAKPLDDIHAQTFCENYAKVQFPYGVKLHTVAGKLAEEKTEAGWYMKYEASITNEFGAKRDSNVECHMSGTNGTPVMDDFVAY